MSSSIGSPKPLAVPATSSAPRAERVGPRWLRETIVPLSLVTLCPPTAILLWYTHVHLGGSLSALGHQLAQGGVLATLLSIWKPVFFGSKAAWSIIGIFAAIELVLMRLLPGKPFHGPITPAGNVPVYKANGVAAFAATIALFAVASGPLGLFSPAIVYDHFGEIIGALNVFSLVFCLGLYFKGRFKPSSTDHGHTGNPIFDYYWGTELYPRVLGWDVKQFTNCRFGMMAWPVILISFAAKQAQTYGLSDSMIVSVGIQLVYIAKFYWWETGYLRSLDIMHDRAGFYICWGCLVWVPSVYTSASLYLVNHPIHLGTPLAILIFVAGVASVFINYLADAQRQRVRATDGKTKVWGKPPVMIVGHYRTTKGEDKTSILLASGWWGISRHFHYVPEILGAFFWSLPALFSNVLPYFYVIFLTILLTDRAFRDDNRCAAKYGRDWDTYRSKVRYRIIPGLI
jgi:7-dehydrocholesterol reductase